MPEVTLEQILNSREKRAKKQKELITSYSCPLICFTMNIAGPTKVTPLIKRAFYEGVKLLDSALSSKNILFREIEIFDTGCEAMYSVSLSANKLKSLSLHIENTSAIGRLFDIDVIDTNFKKIERSTQRGCIVCGASGRGCAASRAHSVKELQTVTNNIITEYFKSADTDKIVSIATNSLLQEVHTTPKPGLVDCNNSGSHKDMDINTFIKSIDALGPYFRECVTIGQESAPLSPNKTFDLLKSAGIEAEKAMYSATNGVNTYKGIIYSLGILCGVVGRLWKPEKPIAKASDIFAMCAEIVKPSLEKSFGDIGKSTAGGRLYFENNITGIRGEVASGFSSVTSISLPAYKKALENGLSQNDAGVTALLHLISKVKDTNLYHRGGEEGAKYAANSARLLLESFPPDMKKIEELDRDFISKNLSPGGCADLLAITFFIYNLDGKYKNHSY